MVGLELINTMCQRMNIDWNFLKKMMSLDLSYF